MFRSRFVRVSVAVIVFLGLVVVTMFPQLIVGNDCGVNKGDTVVVLVDITMVSPIQGAGSSDTPLHTGVDLITYRLEAGSTAIVESVHIKNVATSNNPVDVCEGITISFPQYPGSTERIDPDEFEKSK